MSYNEGVLTFQAGEDLASDRRVKIESGSTTTPPEVVYADAGEKADGVTLYSASDGDMVAVKPLNFGGTVEIEAAGAITKTNTIYGADDGKISTTATGAPLGQALETASGSGASIACLCLWDVAMQAVYDHLQTAQAMIPVPLGAITLEDGTALTTFSDGSSATPGFNQVSNKEVVLRWNNCSAPSKVAASLPLPNDLDSSQDVVVHWLAKASGTTDTPTLEHECYFNAGDTDCAGTDDEVDGGTTLTEYSATVQASNVPSAPGALTVVFGPKSGELGTDDLLVYGFWIEYTRKLLTS
jgi:hypothetical protein